MNIVDANVLIYAVNEAEPRHDEAREWLDAALTDEEPVGFAWTALLAFVRLSTRVDVFPRPLSVDQAMSVASDWLAQRSSTVVEATPRHLAVLSGLLAETGAGGNLVSDAHLAALAVEHHGTIISYDNDFDRFRGVRWRRPG